MVGQADREISELKRQKRWFEALLELSLTAIATVDPQSNVISWNPAAERLFGYTAAEAIGRHIDHLIANDPRVRDEALGISAKLAAGGDTQIVTQRTRKDGSLVDVQVVAAPMVVGGEHVGQYALYHDISELQRQKQYYSSLFELSPTAVVTLDLNEDVGSWNAAAERLFGYAAEEAIGRNIDDLIAYDERFHADAVELSQQGLLGEEGVFVRQRLRKDGTLVDVEIRASAIVVGGEQVGTYVIYHDISELQRQKQYYASLFELSPTAVVAFDADERVTAWNPAAEELFGYTEAEAIGRKLDDLVANDERLRADARELSRRALLDDQVDAVTQRTRKDGSLVDVHLHGCAIVVGGEHIGRYALYHDVGELERARRAAEAATAAKSTFLATMSHEIRTPMNAVIGMTELLLGTELDAEQRGFAEVIRTSGEALLSVINDILDFSKIEAGRLDLERKPFDLRACVESAFDLVAALAAEKGLDLAYVLDEEVPEAVVGDETRLRQVLLNLLNNAVKFTERGEIVLTVDVEPAEEELYVLHFALRDTGIGVPEERVETLFESFTQADESTTRRFGGTGLGLAISRRLTEAMGGRIWAESRSGEGSVFHFTIAAAAAPRPVRRYEEAAAAPLEGRRVLILDDNATNRRILQAYVQSWGMLPRETGSPTEALEWVRRGDPLDLAILDMQMPELDGLAVAREIRRHRDAERLPLILLTSLGRREQDAEADFAAHLTKPIRPSQLYDALLDVLGGEGPTPRFEQPAEPEPVVAQRAPLRILVAEDNALNQRLALLLLEKLGHRGDVATNGLEALAALERRRYDVVLMDVQMPEMDGLEATRRIHERWGAERPRIVAVTAGVLSDERDRCLEAGMDDYISKPVRFDALASALGGISPRDGRDAVDLDELRAMLGDDAAVAELVETFLAEAPKLIVAMQSGVAEGDAVKVRLAAHTLKSNAATFGAAGLAELCAELERLAQAGSLSGAAELVARAEAAFAETRSALEVTAT